MRERTTWSRDAVKKAASEMAKRAEDPRAMNQDHIQQQPPADKYLTGDPSTFAEDVHPSAQNWKAEYTDGQTTRDAIGLPAMRSDTFDHPEKDPGSTPARGGGGGGGKQAALDEETLVKKAEVCVKVARSMLGSRATEAAVEDQALALMNLSDPDLIATANRLANQDEDEEKKQAAQQDEEEKKQAQQKKEEDEKKQAAQQQDEEEKKQAKELPPEFKEQIEKKKEEAKDKKEAGQQQDDDDEKKQAGQMPDFIKKKIEDSKDDKDDKKAAMRVTALKAVQAAQQGDQKGFQAAIATMVQQGISAGQQQQTLAQQIEQMIQQAVQQGSPKPPGSGQQMSQQQMDQQALDAMLQQQAPMAQQQTDDQMIDQMLAQGQPQQTMPQHANDFGIQLESPSMDIGEVGMTPEDDVLGTLFASHAEVQSAQQAHVLQHGAPAPMTVQAAGGGMTRTASTQTVGTRPTGGVSKLGGLGSPAPAASSGEVEKLSNLWNSAPDVSEVFRT